MQELFQNGGALTFTVQLVDAVTNESIGTYDNVVYNASNTSEYRNILFDVDCEGIGTRTVKLRLTITNTAASAEQVVLGSYIVPLPEEQMAKMMAKTKTERVSFWRGNGAVAKASSTVKTISFKGAAVKGKESDAVVTKNSLDQNYPNPFNPSTSIKFALPEKARVTITVYNQLGVQVDLLLNAEKEAGYHNINWYAGNMASGVYFYELKTEKFRAVKKLLLLK